MPAPLKMISSRFDQADGHTLDGYLRSGGYAALRATFARTPEEVITTETLSDLYGTPIEVLTTSDGRRVVVGQPDASSHHVGHHGPHDHGPHAGHDHTTDEC